MLILTGTRQFCLDYRLPICRGAVNDPTHGDDTVIGDISVVCFRKPPSTLPPFPLNYLLFLYSRTKVTG